MNINKYNSMKIAIVPLVCLFFVSFSLYAANTGEEKIDALQKIQRVRSLWKQVNPNNGNVKQDSLMSVLTDLKKMRGEFSNKECVTIDYLIARIQYLTNQKLDGEYLTCKDNIPMLMESVLIWSLKYDKPHRDQSSMLCPKYVAIFADLVPISICRKMEDGKTSKYDGFVNPCRPIIPTINQEIMFKIASEFERAGQWDLAWRAYAEAIYANYNFSFPRAKTMDGSWLSTEAAKYWIKVSDCAYKAGEKDVAMNFLVKSVIFGQEDLKEAAGEMISCWSTNKNPDIKTETIDKNIQREALTNVIKLYIEINAHPRALQLIDKNRDIFDNSDELYNKILVQWVAVVKDVCRVASKVTLYGYDVYPTGDPRKIKIPWAFSDEAVTAVQNKFK